LKENQLNVTTRFRSMTTRRNPFVQALTQLGFGRKVLIVDHQGEPESAPRSAQYRGSRADSESTDHAISRVERASRGFLESGHPGITGGAVEMSTFYEIIKRPIITEKGLTLKEQDRTLCFEVADNASKTQIQQAVERLFKVKVQHVRTMTVKGKMRRRGRYSGYRPDWKKAYVTLREGEKMVEYGENF
jgi:large subunit ribosomal protein L23